MRRNKVKNIYLVKRRHKREERLESLLDPLMTLGKAVMVLVAVALIVSGFWLGRDFLLVTPYFNVKTIKVIGNENVSSEDIIKMSDIKIYQNIFKLNLAKIQCLLKQNPLFDQVYVKRHIPDTIEICVKERKARALLNVEGEIYQVDEQAVIFQKLPLPTKFNLPIITNTNVKNVILGEKNNSIALEIGIGFLKDIMISDPILMDDISEINLRSLDDIVIYTNKGIKLRVDRDIKKYKWLYVNRIINIADKEKMDIDYLDMRYNDQIILKPSV